MPTVLRALPYFDRTTTLEVQGETVDVLAHQIVVWVSVAPVGRDGPPLAPRRFPAILDTGFTGSFTITPNQLRRWAGVEWNTLPFDPLERKKYHGVEVPLRRANVWLHPNQFGWRDHVDPTLPPFLLELHGGIAVYGDGVWIGTKDSDTLAGPRLPLLGLRALTTNRVHLRIDAAVRAVWMESDG